MKRGGAAVAREAHNLKVVGSNPTPATKVCGDVAQWLEQGLHKAEVGSSNLPIATIATHLTKR